MIDRLSPSHFFEPQHRIIFEAIYDIYTKGGRISYTASTINCARRGLPAPDEALIQLTEAFASEVGAFAELSSRLVEKEAKRRILRAAQEIQRMIFEETEEKLDDYISKAQQLIFEATNVAQDSDESRT